MWGVCVGCVLFYKFFDPTSRPRWRIGRHRLRAKSLEEECEGLAGLHQGVNGYLRECSRHRLSPASLALLTQKIDACVVRVF